MTDLIWILAGLLVVVGVLGTVLPALPGATLVFGGLALAAWIDHFQRVGPWTLAALALLTLLTFAIDLAATALGAKRVGASWLAIAGAALGTRAGLPCGLRGGGRGPCGGAGAGAGGRRRDWRQAGRVGFGTALGLALGVVAKLAVVFVMLGLFVMAYVL